MKKYIKLKKHERVLQRQFNEINRLRILVVALQKQVSNHAEELRREVTNARHGTLQQHVEEINKRLREQDEAVQDNARYRGRHAHEDRAEVASLPNG